MLCGLVLRASLVKQLLARAADVNVGQFSAGTRARVSEKRLEIGEPCPPVTRPIPTDCYASRPRNGETSRILT